LDRFLYNFMLSGDMAFQFGNVPIGLGQMPIFLIAIHARLS